MMLNNYSKDFKAKLENFQKQIDSASPFYQIESYGLLCRIDNEYIELTHILEMSIGLEGMTFENRDKVNSGILPKIGDLKDKLAETISR